MDNLSVAHSIEETPHPVLNDENDEECTHFAVHTGSTIMNQIMDYNGLNNEDGNKIVNDISLFNKFSEESYICTSKMSPTENKILLTKQVKYKPSVSGDMSHETHKDILSTIVNPQVEVFDSSIDLQETCSLTNSKQNGEGENMSQENGLEIEKYKNFNSTFEAKVEKKQNNLKRKLKGNGPLRKKKFNTNKYNTLDNNINTKSIDRLTLTLEERKEHDSTSENNNSSFDQAEQSRKVDTDQHSSLGPVDDQVQICNCSAQSNLNCDCSNLTSSDSDSDLTVLTNIVTIPRHSTVELTTNIWDKMCRFVTKRYRTVSTQVDTLNDELYGTSAVQYYSKSNNYCLDIIIRFLVESVETVARRNSMSFNDVLEAMNQENGLY